MSVPLPFHSVFLKEGTRCFICALSEEDCCTSQHVLNIASYLLHLHIHTLLMSMMGGRL